MSNFDYGVFIGRFQPLHVGHERVIRDALSRVNKLIIIVGSCGRARTPVNPFNYEERLEMLHSAFNYEISSGRIIVAPASDHPDDNVWAEQIRDIVKDNVLNDGNSGVRLHGMKDFKIALAGYGKDSSSFYLKMFPEWGSIQLETQHGTINASDIRKEYLRRLPHFPRDAVNDKLLKWLVGFSMTPAFSELVKEAEYYREYGDRYPANAYLTADSIVLYKDEILLVTRGKTPGKGLLAMPGGFLNENERFLDASIRELREETGLRVDRSNLVKTIVADNPRRSLRGRVVSVVNVFRLDPSKERPSVTGADDAVHADWYRFEDLASSRFFDDHHDIISEYYESEE